jgi:predicted small metal-binding protein
MLSLACRDTGASVIECDYVARGETEEELWENGTEHIVKVHGMKIEDITPQFKNYYKHYIKHS